MGTNYIAPTWRMPENTNKDKLSNYSINFDGQSRTHIGISEVKGGPLLPGGQTYTSNVTVQNPKFSGSAFINFDTSSAYPVGNIVGVGQFGGASFWFLRKNANNNIEFLVRTDAGSPYYATITGSTVLNANQWYHAAFSWDGNTITLYLNGSVDGSGSATTFYNSSFQYSGYASIGSYWRGGIDINTLWVGELSQVSIFDYALSTDQINYLHNLNNPMAISGAEPIAYYPLGDNSNPVTPAGYPNISVGAGSVFDFANSNIEVDSIGDLFSGITNFSFSGWFNLTSFGGRQVFNILEGNKWKFGINTYNNQLRFNVNPGFAYIANIQNITSTNTWFHYAGVFDGSGASDTDRLKLYINGQPQTVTYNTTTPTSFPTLLSTADISIGGTLSPFNGMTGKLSNIKLWTSSLTPSEVETLYNNGQPLMTGTQPQEANLKAWYKLNQTDSYWNIGETGKWTFNNAALN